MVYSVGVRACIKDCCRSFGILTIYSLEYGRYKGYISSAIQKLLDQFATSLRFQSCDERSLSVIRRQSIDICTVL